MSDLKLLLDSINADSLSRLRWRILREFGCLPNSRDAQALTDAELILYGLHLCIDNALTPSSFPNAPAYPNAYDSADLSSSFNPDFDYARFAELGGD